MEKWKVNIICFADDAVLIADNEKNLQRQLYIFYKTAEEPNIITSVKKPNDTKMQAGNNSQNNRTANDIEVPMG